MSHESHNQCLKLKEVENIRDEMNTHFRKHMQNASEQKKSYLH